MTIYIYNWILKNPDPGVIGSCFILLPFDGFSPSLTCLRLRSDGLQVRPIGTCWSCSTSQIRSVADIWIIWVILQPRHWTSYHLPDRTDLWRVHSVLQFRERLTSCEKTCEQIPRRWNHASYTWTISPTLESAWCILCFTVSCMTFSKGDWLTRGDNETIPASRLPVVVAWEAGLTPSQFHPSTAANRRRCVLHSCAYKSYKHP